MRIECIGDPFVPRWLEGVCVHVDVRDADGTRWKIRVLIADRHGSPSAAGHDISAANVANQAIAEDIRRRPEAYAKAFDELDRLRATANLEPNSRPG